MTQKHTDSRFDPSLPAPAEMSHPIDATPFVQIAVKRGHRRKFGREPRVMLSGATIDVSTLRQIARWRGKTLSLGLLTDQLVAFAKKKKFTPDRTRK